MQNDGAGESSRAATAFIGLGKELDYIESISKPIKTEVGWFAINPSPKSQFDKYMQIPKPKEPEDLNKPA